jgi:PPOX class probable F420-dependent enzyme
VLGEASSGQTVHERNQVGQGRDPESRERVPTERRGIALTGLLDFSALLPLDNGLCVLSAVRRDGTVAASVVNAGVLGHPLTSVQVVGFVARGLRKLHHLRRDPRATIVARAGWRWVAVEGAVTIFGPDDPQHDIDSERLRLLLRDVFLAAGGTHDDWDTYDRTMLDERSAAVLITPQRIYSNPVSN